MQDIGKILMIVAVLLLIVGALLFFLGDKLSWLGNLPGDIRIERENVKIYIPITTMILLSVVLSAIIWLLRKLG
jgi:H+/Cl- antiporter ClcA